MDDIVKSDIEILIFLTNGGLGNAYQIFHDLHQRGCVIIQGHLAALNPGHIQNIINQSYQQPSRKFDFS